MNFDEVDVKVNGEESLFLGSKEVKVGWGSLGVKDFYFIFLWCFGVVCWEVIGLVISYVVFFYFIL